MMVDLPCLLGDSVKGQEYTCERCGNTYIGTRTEEELLAKLESSFGKYANDGGRAVVCDDCYQELVAWKPPQQWVAEREASKRGPEDVAVEQ